MNITARDPYFTGLNLPTQIALVLFFSLLLTANALAQTASPPEFGQETKGTPAVTEKPIVVEKTVTPKETEAAADTDQPVEVSEQTAQPAEQKERQPSFLGNATITESRRENGQLYLVEFEHSAGAKQYMEENDSDGKIESTSNDIEETPNLPKWKIGSW